MPFTILCPFYKSFETTIPPKPDNKPKRERNQVFLDRCRKGLGFLKSVSGALSELQVRVEEANASRAAAQEHLRDLRGLVSGGWTFFGGSAYFFLQEAKTWADAEQSCQSRGAHLTSVTSQGEMKHLAQQSGGQTFWIGLTDQYKKGNWTWADGTKYDPGASLWSPRQPDNWVGGVGNREDCVHASQQWNDISCSYSYKAFCEKAIP
ncbi:C-type lectin domain family 4 member F-like [Anolis sagrei]|uniref:C-type lectin domain family 4 member F-like n=1 Tax=Anolis sagrei TaxID=38937 RepID=UPI00351FFDA6